MDSQSPPPRDPSRFEQIVESSIDAICLLEPNGVISYVNPAWEHLTGYAAAESHGKTLHFIRSDKTARKALTLVDDAIAHGQPFLSEEIIHRRKDGREYYASLQGYPLAEEPLTGRMVVAHRDITERKIAEISESEFVSLVSHQLRSPLTSIIWNLEILRDADLKRLPPDQLSTLIGTTHRSSKRMAETIDTLLQLSNLEVGKTQPNFAYVELPTLLETVRSEQLPEYLKKEQTVNIDCPANLTLSTDSVLLKEILTNLLNNSVKYTPPRGTMVLRAFRADGAVTIEVSDTGYGIPQRQQDKVFTKFFRGDNVRYIENTGNGLGLYLVKNLIELVHGRISFRSIENDGTTFTLVLPERPPSDSERELQSFVRELQRSE